MRIVLLAFALMLIAMAVPGSVRAQDHASPAAERWSFKRVDDGFVRLDAKTGQVAHCTPVKAGWACQAVPEDRAALEKEVARLQSEVAALKKEVARLQAVQSSPSSADRAGGIGFKMPTQEDIAHAKDYVAATWRRLVQMLVDFQKDVLRTG